MCLMSLLKFSKKYHRNTCIIHWLIIRIRMEEVVEGEVLKICRLSRFRRLWNVECYVMYF